MGARPLVWCQVACTHNVGLVEAVLQLEAHIKDDVVIATGMGQTWEGFRTGWVWDGEGCLYGQFPHMLQDRLR